MKDAAAVDRHASTDELLAARDGAATAWTTEHLSGCGACSAELFRLDQTRARLRSLPGFAPPRDRWAVIARRAQAERRSRRWHAASGVTAAAVLAAVVFAAVRPATDAAADQAALERAMTRNRALEQTLRVLEPERRALSGAAASVAAELESRVSRLDVQLGEPDVWRGDPRRRIELWRERAGLMGALVDVHVTRAAAAGL